jgi:phosphoglycolate phosphatase-like HAD superfamily hydrolase
MKLVLFDIDGTLVQTGGAGMRAMSRAFAELYRAENALDGVALAGRTDRAIVNDVLERVAPGVVADESWMAGFLDRYCALLDDELESGAGTGKAVLPGVAPLLDALADRDDVVVALLTGNFARSARIKLAHFRLWQYFACGAFGDLHVDRNHLLAVALEAARGVGGRAFGADRVCVIGDTPLDVACARFGGARAVAVATGPHPTEDLRRAGADVVFDDLSDTRTVIREGLGLAP